VVIALGFWSLAIGYTLVYTGVQWFTSGSSSLAANLGLKSALITAPTTGAKGSIAPGTGNAAVGAGGPTGTGYPSSSEVVM